VLQIITLKDAYNLHVHRGGNPELFDYGSVTLPDMEDLDHRSTKGVMEALKLNVSDFVRAWDVKLDPTDLTNL
jgi:hypothetical protein